MSKWYLMDAYRLLRTTGIAERSFGRAMLSSSTSLSAMIQRGSSSSITLTRRLIWILVSLTFYYRKISLNQCVGLFFQSSHQGPYFGQLQWFSFYHQEEVPSAIARSVPSALSKIYARLIDYIAIPLKRSAFSAYLTDISLIRNGQLLCSSIGIGIRTLADTCA